MNNIYGMGSLGRGARSMRRMRIMGQSDDNADPRSESFWNFSKSFCCPNFTFLSATFIISVLDVLIYLITLFHGGIKHTPTELLAPVPDTLDTFGMKVN
jgi:hypothetical protein